MYGIYNIVKKEFQFGICELTMSKARKELYSKIGKDSYKWRFMIKEIPEENLTTSGKLAKVTLT